MEPEQKPTVPRRSEANVAWARTAMWVGTVTVLVAGAVLILRSCLALPERVLQSGSDTVQKAGRALASVAAAFRQRTVQTSFFSYATTLTNTHYLQFATLKQTEVFTRTEEPSTAFGYVLLPDVVVEARAPVEYTFYVDLNAKWEFKLRHGVIEVMAPSIRANHPSIDVSGLTYEVKQGRFKTDEALENLKNSISALAILRAKENIPLVRETGRRQITEFVEHWLAHSFSDGKTYPVKVYFPGETAAGEPKAVELPTH